MLMSSNSLARSGGAAREAGATARAVGTGCVTARDALGARGSPGDHQGWWGVVQEVQNDM